MLQSLKEKSELILGKIRKMDKRGKIVLLCSSIVAMLTITVLLGFTILRESGKQSLYGNADSKKPNLHKAEKQTEEYSELDINPDQMDEVEIVQNETSETTTSETKDSETQESTSDNIQNNNVALNGSENITNSTVNLENSIQQNTVIQENLNSESIEPEIEEIEETEKTTQFQSGNPDKGDDYDIIYKDKKYVYNKDTINLLFLGVDKREKVSPAKDGISGGQSDAIFILTLNPKTKIIDMIAIPRDTITKIDLYDREGNYTYSGYAQVCLQHGYGDGMELSNERAKTTISKMLYDLPIQSVTSINMGAIPDLNDAFGGITLNSLYTFYDEGYQFVKGEEVHLKGNIAYSYVHYRDTSRHYTAPERLERQKQYMLLFIEKAMHEIHENAGKVVEVYNAIKEYVVTDLKIDDMTYLASELVKYTFGEIHTLEGRVDTSRKYERYYLDEDALYELIINQFYEEIK